jgi:tetratricopeptide (TPR) repeat protein
MKKNAFKTVICLAIFVLLAGISTVTAQQDRAEELRRHIRYAQTAAKNGNYQDALNEYNNALKLAPQEAEIYKAIGAVHEKLATTADLKAAIKHYNRYVELAPNASDVRQIKDKIYDLEYMMKTQINQDSILDDLSGQWVAVDSLEIYMDENTGKMSFWTDFIFNIEEIQKTGTYRVTMEARGSKNYSDNLIEKTINIVPAKNNSFTFTFAKSVVYTPKSGKYALGRFAGRLGGAKIGLDWFSELSDIAISTAQEADLPNNTQTSYTFALKYDDGKLVGVVNIIDKFANPTQQQTTGNKIYPLTFVKNDERLYYMAQEIVSNKPDIIENGKNKYGRKLSRREIANKLYALDPELGRSYYLAKNRVTASSIFGIAGYAVLFGSSIPLIMDENNPRHVTTGIVMMSTSFVCGIVGLSVAVSNNARKHKLIKQYNNRVLSKQKPATELRLGFTPSGGVGLTLNF